MKKLVEHFEVEIPLSKDVIEDCRLRTKHTGSLSVSGVGYYDGSDYEYDIDEIFFILPKDHKDHTPNGVKLDLEQLEIVCGWEPKEEDHIDMAVINHLIGLFSEMRERERNHRMTDQLMSSLIHHHKRA